jgi:hypothetical protein
LRQVLRRMRAADRQQIAEDEERHAVNARFIGRFGLGLDARDVLVGCKTSLYLLAIHAAVGRRLDQHLAVGEVTALTEIQFHQPLLHACRVGRPGDQPVAVDGVGLAFDLVTRINETGRRRGVDHALAVRIIAFNRAELGGEVVLPAHAFARHPWVEQIWMEAHFHRNVRLERDRPLEMALADVAPGANYVRDDIDGQRSHGAPPARRHTKLPISQRQPSDKSRCARPEN